MDTVTRTGPLFDGRAAQAVQSFCEAVTRPVAEEGVNVVRAATSVFRHETGAYASGIRAEHRGGESVITDGGSRYGPWLAGTSARNAGSTFGGYDHWQRATAELQAKADVIAEVELRPFISRMN